MAREFKDFDVTALQGYFSDLHKDFMGCRPRFGTEAQWTDRSWLIWNINLIHDLMDGMKKTFEGREELRIRGWIIPEEEPELILRAAVLQDERDAEYEKWSDSVEA